MSNENRTNRSSYSEHPDRAASMSPIEDGVATISDEDSVPQIDDGGTDQSEAAQIVKRTRDEVFDSSNEKLALALGRTSEEIAEWLNGERIIDGDALMKLRALEQKRE